GGASFALADVPSLRPEPPAPPRERGPRLLGVPVVRPAPTGAAAPDSPAAPAPPPGTPPTPPERTTIPS
ncbi:MAG TPA: hypothetical protein VHG28_00960, partial [Longimicrobiaceae bacterium]|nr:hypothetical protein [Longimicrobiaceae bacterium]